jgi:hypothetical protein
MNEELVKPSEAKKFMEHQILMAVRDFEEKTGFQVCSDGISLIRGGVTDIPSYRISGIVIKIY